MTPFFDRLDFASDAVFLLSVAYAMLAISLAIGVYVAARRLWRWVGRRKRQVAYADIEKFVAKMKTSTPYTGPAYWPAMDRLREMWVEREVQEKHGSST